MTMAPCSADIVSVRNIAVHRMCICHPCVYGFGIPLEVDGETFRFCGELCVVGRPVFVVAGDDDVMKVAAANPTNSSPSSVPLRCNICSVQVDHSLPVDDTSFLVEN